VVTENNPSQTASQALVSGTDPVSEEQQALGGEGAAGAQTDFVGRAEFQRMMEQHEVQVRGLQRAVDQSRDALSEATTAKEQADQDAFIAAQSEEMRPILQHLHEQNKQTRQEIAALRQGQQSGGNGVVEASPEAKEFVRARGANPDDARINYALFDGSNAGTWAFIDNIDAVKSGQPVAAPAAVQAPPQPAPAPQPVPPSPNDAPSSQGNLTTEEEIYDWGLTTGNLTEMYDKLRAAGFPT
jgi:hypothetical protein